MSSRVLAIRKRVAVATAAVLAVAFGAVTTWGRQPRTTGTGGASILQQEQDLAQGTDNYAESSGYVPDAQPAPMTTRQS